MKALNAVRIQGVEVLPLLEGGKGVSATNGLSSGAWAAAGGIGTVSAVNADSYDDNGDVIPQIYRGKTRRERHEELVAYGIQGGLTQVQRAHDVSGGKGRLHINVLWEMGGAERVLKGVLEGAKGLVHGVTCGAGMPYRLAEIAAGFGVNYYPIVSSGRAFRALWKRAYHKFSHFLGGVVYEDPWLAGGHNGLSNSEDPLVPEDPYPRVVQLRQVMNEAGLHDTPVIMAGGVWYLREWQHFIDNPEVGPVIFQFGTRPLLTKESPIPESWKQRLTRIAKGEVSLHRFSPTGFYSSAVRNPFLRELEGRVERQIAYSSEPVGDHQAALAIGARGRLVYVTPHDKERAEGWIAEGYTEAMRTPDHTMIFVTPKKAREIHKDQIDCMGCLSACKFSNWSQGEEGSTGKKADPRSFCIQKTLQEIAHGGDPEENLMFAGHSAYRFGTDPFYSNGFVPTVRQLIDRLVTGD
ncbi:nitronate monooxygenase [Zavarzinia compransoris]|uniref:NAD(P)H-dependent flavin oxidoreductase n=1 Tax=Zavarzinia marina TaxID=2911065 RepID=UPI001F2AD778|nr:nitronate monooxygenase [Zavarzinia marina]MCF4165458.1 nitronate monooxygenase [Zavarzinia marina]